MYESQCEMVLNHLKRNGPLTSNEALSRYSIGRLASCIHLLRADGWAILTTTKKGKNKFGKKTQWGSYSLIRKH